jgi:hypothetical protein
MKRNSYNVVSLPKHISAGIDVTEDGCWLWNRSKSKDGYGWASLRNKTVQAHRLVYKLLKGEPPQHLQLDHLCRVRHCVNPEHLEPVTPLKNLLRSPLTTAGRSICVKGHKFIHNGHQRRCPVCLAEYVALNREKRIQYLRAYRKSRRLAA